LAEYLKLEEDVGVSNYLMDAARIDEAYHAYTPIKNLFVMPSGPMPPNPSELMESGRLQKLFENIPEDFDQVIIDTPPAGIIADAVLLGEFVVKTLYVSRANVTHRPMIKQAVQMMDNGKLVNPSFVFNGAPKSNMYGYKYSNKYFN